MTARGTQGYNQARPPDLGVGCRATRRPCLERRVPVITTLCGEGASFRGPPTSGSLGMSPKPAELKTLAIKHRFSSVPLATSFSERGVGTKHCPAHFSPTPPSRIAWLWPVPREQGFSTLKKKTQHNKNKSCGISGTVWYFLIFPTSWQKILKNFSSH